MRPSLLLVLGVFSASADADSTRFEAGGHIKGNLAETAYPPDSLLRDVLGKRAGDARTEFRLDLEWRREQWTVDAAYQLLAIQGDSVAFDSSVVGAATFFSRGVPDDRRRALDLTAVIHESMDVRLAHRLDRLSIAWSSNKTVVRLGRQALTWGNGFFYAPMDLVNPFDPTVVDTEYKFGDDMLYAQYLRDNGDDLQAAVVFRRDAQAGIAGATEATVAVKYHGFSTTFEYDVLIGESFGDTVLGLGMGRSVGGAEWAADLVVTNTDRDVHAELVSNLSYSWTLAGRNATGVLEYYFNGFGLDGERYSPALLSEAPDLRARLRRGQSFALGRHYLAGSVTVEMTPLWTLSPQLLSNLGDPSAYLQLTSSYSLSDNLTLLGSISAPLGASGTEFGGIDTDVPGRYLSSGASLFAQIAWYF